MSVSRLAFLSLAHLVSVVDEVRSKEIATLIAHGNWALWYSIVTPSPPRHNTVDDTGQHASTLPL